VLNFTIPQGPSGVSTLAGDVVGNASATTVVALQGQPISATPPAAGQLLRWSGSSWDAVNGRPLIAMATATATAGVAPGIGIWVDLPGLSITINSGTAISDATISYTVPLEYNNGATDCKPLTRILVDGVQLGWASAVSMLPSGIVIATQTQLAAGLSAGVNHVVKVQMQNWQSTCTNIHTVVGNVGAVFVSNYLSVMGFAR
jgi:hypothetical protein